MPRRILPTLLLAAAVLAGCGQPEADPEAVARAAAVPSPPAAGECPAGDGFGPPGGPGSGAETVQALYARSCAACHGRPGTGAPPAHDPEAWRPRLARGMDALLAATVQGRGGMPPMGLCMDCSEAQLRALIAYLSGPPPEDRP